MSNSVLAIRPVVAADIARVKKLHNRILAMGRLQTRDALQIGKTLRAIKARLHDAGERTFKKLAESKVFGFNYATAKRYMALYRYSRSGLTVSPKLQELPLTEAYEVAGLLRFHSAAEGEALKRRRELVPIPDKIPAGLPVGQIVCGDALSVLKKFPAESVNCVITSPPYYQQRDYGVRGQIGQEKTIAEYIDKLVAVFEQVRRVLRSDGVLFVNLGDSYAGAGGTGGNPGDKQFTSVGSRRKKPHWKDCEIASKNLLGCPWRLALAMQEAGWNLRADIIWKKPSVFPENVRDRVTREHEYIFHFAKTENYYYDQDEIREQPTGDRSRYRYKFQKLKERPAWLEIRGARPAQGRSRYKSYPSFEPDPRGRNKRSVWVIPAAHGSGEHFATFPEALVDPLIRVGCPEGGIVLDPFCGAGTSCRVAKKLKRQWVGVELNPKYCRIARKGL